MMRFDALCVGKQHLFNNSPRFKLCMYTFSKVSINLKFSLYAAMKTVESLLLKISQSYLFAYLFHSH
jgi:hypothetical protein